MGELCHSLTMLQLPLAQHSATLPPPLLSCLSCCFLLSDKKEAVVVPPAVVMPTPSKRGRKSKQAMGRLAGVGGVLPPGSDALILAHLAAGGQVKLISLFLCLPAFTCLRGRILWRCAL